MVTKIELVDKINEIQYDATKISFTIFNNLIRRKKSGINQYFQVYTRLRFNTN